MMKKIINLMLVALLGLSAVQCNTDETAYTPFSKGRMANGFREGAQYNVGDSITLLDLSQGVTKRLWSFDTEDVNFVVGDEQSELVKISFNEHGKKNIALNCDFIDPEYKFQDKTWVTILKKVKIEMLANKIVDFTSEYTMGPELDEDTGEPIETPTYNYEPISLNAGESIDFNLVTEGFPGVYEWILPGSDKEALEIDEVGEKFVRAGYFREGTFDVTVIASRYSPDGADTLVLKDFVSVAASTTDAQIRGLSMTEDEELLVSFSSVLKAPAATIANEFTVSRNGFIIPITGVRLNSLNPTQMFIEIMDGVWNGDDILVSYTGEGLETTTGFKVNGITDNVDDVTDYQIVYQPLIENLVVNGDFERADIQTMMTRQDGATCDYNVFENVDTYAYKGRRSLKLTGVQGVTGLNAETIIDYDMQVLGGKQYKFEYMMKTDMEFYGYGYVPVALRSSSTGKATDIASGEGNVWLASADGWVHAQRIWKQSTTAGDATYFLKFPGICYLPTDDASVAGTAFTYYIDEVKFYQYDRHPDPEIPTGEDVTIPGYGAGSGM